MGVIDCDAHVEESDPEFYLLRAYTAGFSRGHLLRRTQCRKRFDGEGAGLGDNPQRLFHF